MTRIKPAHPDTTAGGPSAMSPDDARSQVEICPWCHAGALHATHTKLAALGALVVRVDHRLEEQRRDAVLRAWLVAVTLCVACLAAWLAYDIRQGVAAIRAHQFQEK